MEEEYREQEKLRRFNTRIRTFVFKGEERTNFEEYFRANKIGEEEGEQMRLKAMKARNTVVRKMGYRKIVIGLVIVGVSATIFFMTIGMVAEIKRNLDLAVYGGLAVGSLFLSSGFIYTLAPGYRKGEVNDPEAD